MRMEATSLPQALKQAASLCDGTRGIRLLDRRERATFYPWSDLYERGMHAAAKLQKLGVEPTDRVGLILPTSIGFFDAWFGSVLLGAVPVALYPPVRLGRLDSYLVKTAEMLRSVDAQIVVTDSRVGKVLGQLSFELKDVCEFTNAANLVTDSLLSSPSSPSADSLAMIQFSSGSTNQPKAVGLSHSAVMANAQSILKILPSDGSEEVVGVTWLPLYHDMGLIGFIIPAIMQRQTVVVLQPEVFLAKPALWLRAISKYRAMISAAPDFAYSLTTDRVTDAQLDGIDLSCWRFALNGAEPISPTTLNRFTQRFAPFGFKHSSHMPVYGLSEGSLAVTFSASEAEPVILTVAREALCRGEVCPPNGADEAVETTSLVSVGCPVAGVEVEVRDCDGAVVESTVGEVFIKSTGLMMRYLNIEEQPLREGWLPTGDLGFIHNGQLYITGRSKDLIIIRGRNHSPVELERATDSVDGVRKGCCVAVSRITEGGEQVLLFVESKHPTNELAKACKKAVLRETGLSPDAVIVVLPGTLPRTSSGKLQRTRALDLWASGDLTPENKVGMLGIAAILTKSLFGHSRAKR